MRSFFTGLISEVRFDKLIFSIDIDSDTQSG